MPRDSEGIPDFKRIQEIATLLYAENKAGHILSIHSLAEAGIAAGVAKMAFGNGIGAELNTELNLYQERYFSFLIESSAALTEALQATQIGTTTCLEEIQIDGERIALDALLNSWTSPLESTYPTQVKAAHQELSEFS
ncbi:phosphoribosylformylglycinamidine synthase, partial [Akkermansiaceae bacterium]|nr:phosphoribosylformylglycinamidine synthase [Akkermansiaceae bacterium]